MSDGSYCVVRDLGLVRGGKGMRHHEKLLSLSVKSLASKVISGFRHLTRHFDYEAVRKISRQR